MEFDKYCKTVLSAKLADYGPVHGSIVIMPYGMDIWNLMKDQINVSLKATEHKEIYLPLLMPEKYLEEEKEYIQGLSPRYYSVTKAGGKELAEPLAIRPTSETLACYMFAKWIESYRDLPLKVFQWCNIARWEEATQPFIKETEIQWLEGHTIHASHQNALAEVETIRALFQRFLEKTLCIPVSVGLETERRKFVGSLSTITFEAMTPAGRALQIGAIYDLGQNFTQHFNVCFSTADDTKETCWMTDWGLGFRLIGVTALIHGDDRGLRLPPAIAPIHVIILILKSKTNLTQRISDYTERLRKLLSESGIRVHVDSVESRAMSQALREWEMKGVPIIIPVGDTEIHTDMLQLRRRDRSPQCNTIPCRARELIEISKTLLDEISDTLYQEALTYKQQHIVTSNSRSNLQQAIEHNWVVGGWCGHEDCEKTIINEEGQILRYIEKDESFIRTHQQCIICGSKAKFKAVFAKNH